MIVVGGGIIGLASAWRLAQRGVAVTVFDAGRMAGEASWAAAGMLAPGGEFAAASATAALAISSLKQYAAFVEELKQESGLAIDYRVCGAIEVAFDERRAAELDRRAEAQLALGIRSEPCTHEGYRARYYPEEALVNPRDVTGALVQACLRRGVTLAPGEAVLDIEDGGQAIRTSRQTYSSDGLLVAAGAWSSTLYPGLRRSFPVRGHLVGWRSGGSATGPILRTGSTYLITRADGSAVGGSSTEHTGFDRNVSAPVVEDIKSRLARLAPGADLSRAQAWLGFRPGIEGESPAIEQVPGTRIFTAYGHYRNGVLLAPETARRVTELIESS